MIPLYHYAANVLRVVDGDTVDLMVDYGFGEFGKKRFRMYGINTPERGQPGWSEATAFLKELLPVGVPVVIRSYKLGALKADLYGRYVVEIMVGDKNVNEAMIARGLAVPFMRSD